ncbi:hypothetical protein Pan161_02190 [Gimesia algae]|uniref:Uncharacterized protein n=1 Tax=Gimesia algae TaxID=2527971 RepID=A0A517V6G9_9PLAN|nr:hypothetical protein Pan161_02190 [Gimesia algae]
MEKAETPISSLNRVFLLSLMQSQTAPLYY